MSQMQLLFSCATGQEKGATTMLEWGTAIHEATQGEFIASYVGDDGEGVGADVYTTDQRVYVSAASDPEAAHEVVLSCAQMDALALEWLRFRGRFPWMPDE
jgi:hypothetical protein